MPTISSAQLVAVLNVLAKAPVTVGEAAQLHETVQTLIALANAQLPIGSIKPAADAAE